MILPRAILPSLYDHFFGLSRSVADEGRIGRTKGGLNSKLHAVCDGQGRPLVMLLSEGQMSDFKGAALMIDVLPKGQGTAW